MVSACVNSTGGPPHQEAEVFKDTKTQGQDQEAGHLQRKVPNRRDEGLRMFSKLSRPLHRMGPDFVMSQWEGAFDFISCSGSISEAI